MARDVDGRDDFVVAVSNRRGQANGALAAFGRTYEDSGLKNLRNVGAQGVGSLGLVVCKRCGLRGFNDALLIF